jgi:ribose transport system substrate-binding protein
MQNKLPLVVLDCDVPAEKTLFIGQSNVTMAEQVAKRSAEELHGQGNVVVITGLKGSSPAVDRNKGMENVFKEYPGGEYLSGSLSRYRLRHGGSQTYADGDSQTPAPSVRAD